MWNISWREFIAGPWRAVARYVEIVLWLTL
jgi:hypothetical protein